MAKIITHQEVITYANALIVQYIEKKGVSELPRRVSDLKISDSVVDTFDTSASCEKSQSSPSIQSQGDKGQKFETVLESIIYQHLTRAFDNREVQGQTITIQKGTLIPVTRLHSHERKSLPANAKLPELSQSNSVKSKNETPKSSTRPVTVSNEGFQTPTKSKEEALSVAERRKSCKTSPFQRRRPNHGRRDDRPQSAPAGVFTLTSSHTSRLNKRSKENWIPDHIREKMLQRDLSVAKQNLEFNSMYQQLSLSFSIREHKGGVGTEGSSPFERSLTKEKFGLATRKPCGLCCRLFLPINLVMAVPLKAVYDMRETWGDKFDPEGQTSRTVNVNPNLKRAPACYDRTRVCAFCSQLFDDQQEIYRPSFEAKEAERERSNEVERERNHEVMSDPLKQVDEERANILLDEENAAKIACE